MTILVLVLVETDLRYHFFFVCRLDCVGPIYSTRRDARKSMTTATLHYEHYRAVRSININSSSSRNINILPLHFFLPKGLDKKHTPLRTQYCHAMLAHLYHCHYVPVEATMGRRLVNKLVLEGCCALFHVKNGPQRTNKVACFACLSRNNCHDKLRASRW